MKTARQSIITPPVETAVVMESKNMSEGRPPASGAVHDCLRAPIEPGTSMERWLREEIAAGHQEYLADPSKGVPAGDLFRRIKLRRAAQRAR